MAHQPGVAGITVPAFVERSRSADRFRKRRIIVVSPGLRSRPSLSALDVENAVLDHLAGVAGITVPAFVERPGYPMNDGWRIACRRDYGPGLR